MGIDGLRSVGDQTLVTEEVLVFRGPAFGSLRIYDQRGREIGGAERERGRQRKVGYRYRYQVNDAVPRCEVVEISLGLGFDAARGLYAKGREFVISAPDEGHLAKAIWREKNNRASEHVVFVRGGVQVATLRRQPRKEFRQSRPPLPTSNPIERIQQRHDRYVSRQLYYLLDHDNVRVARIASFRTRVRLVLEIEPRVDERIRLIALAACIIADNTLIRGQKRGD